MKEIKLVRAKLNTILTVTSDKVKVPIDAQFRAISDWCFSADRVIVHSDSKPKVRQPDGFRLNPTKSGNPALADIFRAYVVQVPGSEVFAIAPPTVMFNQEQRDFFQHVDFQKMERAWAAYFTSPFEKLPIAFVISAPILPHIMNDLPASLTFEGDSWAVWLHQWMGKFLLQHRYFDATKFDLVVPLVVPTETLEEPAPKAKGPKK